MILNRLSKKVTAVPCAGRGQRRQSATRWVFSLIGLMLLGGGCAGQGPLPAWQRQLERYVAQQGNGDPNVLRDTVDLRARSAPRPARVTFGKLDVPGPGVWPFRDTWDVNGVLVGQHPLGSENWFIFIVGVIQRQPAGEAGMDDIRLLGFASVKNRLRWCVAPETPEAVARYVRTWFPESTGEEGAARPTFAFPSDADLFTLERDDRSLTVTEQHSGATWQMQLPPP